MKLMRRILLIAGIAGAAAWVARIRGRGGVPPTGAGWRELQTPDFR